MTVKLNMKTLFIFLCIICIIIPTVLYSIALYRYVVFKSNCLEYFNLAANANDSKLAEKYITLGINYLEDNDLTCGNTSICIKKPNNDIEFWYNNIKSAQAQLQQINDHDQLTDLDESNILMKLRESLLNSDGEVIHPRYIAYYPNQIFWFLVIAFSWISYIASATFYDNAARRYYK